MSEVIITGTAGRIEGRYHHNKDAKAPTALVLHPHPLFGGTMNNKITYHLYKAFVNNGFSVLRINFRGVGRSQGEFDNGTGELYDASSALNWLQMQNIEASTHWISGFSFGAWIGMQLTMRRPEIEGYIFAAPPATNHDFSFIVPCTASGMVVQGSDDEIAVEQDVENLIHKLSAQDGAIVDYHVVDGADHFFGKQIEEFDHVVDEYIKDRIEREAGRVRKVKRDRRRRRKKKDGDFLETASQETIDDIGKSTT